MNRNKLLEVIQRTGTVVFVLCGIFAILFVLAVTGVLLVFGGDTMAEIGIAHFLFGATWAPRAGEFGSLPLLLSTLYILAGAMLLAAPIALLLSLFLAKALPKRLAGWLYSGVQYVAGVPSVVYGLVALVLVGPWLSAGGLRANSLLLVVLTLAVIVLPYMVETGCAALQDVPKVLEANSIALGAADVETWFLVTLPHARTGLLKAFIRGVGRAFGETLVVLMLAGNVARMPALNQPVATLGTIIAMGADAEGNGQFSLFSLALLLYLLALLLTCFSRLLQKKFKRRRL